MTGARALKVACVGAGYFSQFHYGSWARIDRVELVGSCNRDIEKAQATGLPAYDNLGRMLDEQQPALLDIILPPEAHAETIRTALENGIKWIICQKPFCRDLDQAQAATSLAKSAGVSLIIHDNFRFEPWYRAIKSCLDNGQLGNLLQVTFRLRPGDGQGERAYLDRQPYFQKMEKLNQRFARNLMENRRKEELLA